MPNRQTVICFLSEEGDDPFGITYTKDLTIQTLKETIHQICQPKLKHISPGDLKLHLVALGDDGTLRDVEGKVSIWEQTIGSNRY